jgi:hypothetical protein
MDNSQDEDQDDISAKNRMSSIGNRLLGLLSFSFVDLAGELLDLATLWRSSRRWRRVLAILPVALLTLVFGSLVAVGNLVNTGEKVKWYVERAEEEVKLASGEPVEKETNNEDKTNNKDRGGAKTKVDEPAKPLSESELKLKTEFIDVLFHRVLQLEHNNKRALYYIAYQMSRFGKVSAARPMMESMAPDDGTGFELAHAWVASDLIQRAQKGEPINTETLKHHLKAGTTRKEANPGLLIACFETISYPKQNR